MVFVDTNVFLRFLLADNNKQSREARYLFEQASEGKTIVFTSVIVFFEIYWLFKSLFKKNKEELCLILKKLLKMRFVIFAEREIFEKAINIYQETNLDLEDSYNLAYARSNNATGFKTFDKILSRKFDETK
mgnify:CR=1 FL=1